MFHDDELLAWCWSQAHMLDVGDVEAGGFAPSTQGAYAEVIRFPGVKIVEEGEISEDTIVHGPGIPRDPRSQ